MNISILFYESLKDIKKNSNESIGGSDPDFPYLKHDIILITIPMLNLIAECDG
jgi:hypothetical protein